MLNKAITAQNVVENMRHHNHHTEQLLRLYSDLSIITSGNVLDYYSVIINTEVNEFQFEKEKISTYLFIHVVKPYLSVNISCTECSGLIRINSNPSRIPIFLEQELIYNKEYVWYGFLYEEIFKHNNFNKSALSTTQLHIISKLEERGKLSHNVDTTNINNSIKNLLPFT
jgi:hypothetical protein